MCVVVTFLCGEPVCSGLFMKPFYHLEGKSVFRYQRFFMSEENDAVRRGFYLVGHRALIRVNDLRQYVATAYLAAHLARLAVDARGSALTFIISSSSIIEPIYPP